MKLSDLKVIITDKISMVPNDSLLYVHLILNEIFELVNYEPFAGVSVIAIGDFFQLTPVGGKLIYELIQILCKILMHNGNCLKFLS